MRLAAIAVGLGATGVGWSFMVWRVLGFLRFFRSGQPEPTNSRTNNPLRRTRTLLREFLGHKRMRDKPLIAVAHWVTMMSFLVLVGTLVQATGQLFRPDFALPVIGHWAPLGWLTEAFAWLGLVGICGLASVRVALTSRGGDRSSRLFGSRQWRARYVEATIAVVVICVLALRALEAEAFARHSGDVGWYYPLTGFLRVPFAALDSETLGWWISGVALVKILVSYAWMVVVAVTPTMGVAWHRFWAFATIWTSKHTDGSPALGPLDPIVVDGKPVDLDDPDEHVWERLGVRTARDLTWRDRLALATCTECGRCQEVCPAWRSGKNFSPKLMIQTLRDNAVLVGAAQSGDPRELAPDELWDCATCGACVSVCPVQVEHVDLVTDLRRGKVLVDGDFPSELAGVFRNLERRQNPWGMPTRDRMEWTGGLDFAVGVLGQDVASLAEVDYLYWVGCAGAFDQRGSRTARAFADLLHRAGVRFAVLGEAEMCCGDPARRAGNEPLFASLAEANATALTDAHTTRVVTTCAHCYNTLRSEYGPFGGRFEVIHHTQLLAQIIEDGSLTLPAEVDSDAEQIVTFQDPCYLARHGGETAAPRSVLEAVPGLKLVEMPGRGATCCGGGGCRVFLEEDPDHRVSVGRVADARSTGASKVVSACPYCAIMLDDATTADVRLSGVGERGEDRSPQVVDIATVVLEAVTS